MTATPEPPGGTYFLVPPHHRLFVVFDDPVRGHEAAERLRAEGRARDDEVWIFFGEPGVRSVDPSILGHGLAVGVFRVFQRVFTNDCEYCASLATVLRAGGMVLAVRVGPEQSEGLAEELRQLGGHSFAYGEHWNFVPLADAQAIGSFTG